MGSNVARSRAREIPVRVVERSGTSLERYPVVAGPLDVDDPDSVQVVDAGTGETVPTGVRAVDGGVEVAFKCSVPASGTADYAVRYGGEATDQVLWTRARYNFYDGFDDGRLVGWETTEGEWRESDGTARPYGNPVQMRHPLSDPLDQTAMPISWETRVVSRSTGSDRDQRQAHLRTADDATRVFFMRTYQNDDDGVGGPIGWDSPDDEKLLTADQFAVDDWIAMRARLKPSGDIEAFARNEANGETGRYTYTDLEPYRYTSLQLRDHGGRPGAEWDYVKLRYAVDPEPTVSVDGERAEPARPPTTRRSTTTPPTRAPSKLKQGEVTEVSVGGERYYVVSDVPNTPAGQRAVTTTDYSLVDTDEALDALWAAAYVDAGPSVDIARARIADARERRQHYGIREILDRSSAIGLNLFVSYAMAHVDPTAGIPALVDALSETAAWVEDEIDRPYREAFTRQLDAVHNMQWIDDRTRNVERVTEFDDPVTGVLDWAVDTWGRVDTVGSVADVLLKPRNAEHVYTSATFDMSGVALGFAVGLASDYVEGWFRRDAVLSSAHHSYQTARIAPLQTLASLGREADDGGLSPAQIVAYHVYSASLAQIRAITFDYSAKLYRRMAANEFGTLLVDAGERARTHRRIADGSAQRFALELASLGASYTDARERLAASLNAAEYGGGDR